MMKKFITIFLFIVFLSGCANSLATLEGSYKDAGVKNVDKIIITDVPTKEKRILNDPIILKEFLNYINEVRIMPQESEKEENAQFILEIYGQDKVFKYFVLLFTEQHRDYTNSSPILIIEEYFKKAQVVE